MKKVFLALALLVFSFPAAAWCGNEWTGNVNLTLGNKMLDYEDWKPVDDQVQAGIMFDLAGPGWPVNVALDIFHSWDEKAGYFAREDDPTKTQFGRYTLKTTTADLGVRYYIEEFNHFVPYVEGGLAVINIDGDIEQNQKRFSEADTGVGVWMGLGAYYRLSEAVNLGMDGRYNYASVNVSPKAVSGNAGGFQFAVTVGYHF
ncbi:MAG: outer membrane beta-barrel protein [Thermodesulfobacteriota bacterium]